MLPAAPRRATRATTDESGVYDDMSCNAATIDHAVLAVAYTEDYVVIKNQWSTDWGDGALMQARVCAGLAERSAS